MAFFAALLLTAPFWLDPVGLYQYLGIEIAIWILFALGFNLLFGYAGLHSFGHGAYLGIGAYAFGLFQQESRSASGAASGPRCWPRPSPARWSAPWSRTGAASISR